MKLIDTSVAVDHLRGMPEAVGLLTQLLEDGEPLLASELVRFELLAGVRADELEAVERFFDAITWLSVGEAIARRAGGLARQYGVGHTGIDDVDYLIAATALIYDADLLTINVRHFPMLEGLRPAY